MINFVLGAKRSRQYHSDPHDQYVDASANSYYGSQNGNLGNLGNREVIRIEVPVERRYGFICRVRTVTRERCTLNVTCDINGNKLGNGGQRNYGNYNRRWFGNVERQTLEEFGSQAPPDCRTEFIGCPTFF